jgi:NAD(P)-dependent dehydrogenase (short-subunit alcohol dehydrogenase family)
MTGKLQDRVAVVTGGGRGIGKAVALAFAAEGARLVVASRTIQDLDQVAQRCRQLGATCLPVVTDVARRGDVLRLVEAAQAEFGRIDVLANVAGVYGAIGPIESVDLDGWEQALNINLLGTLYACQAVLSVMVARRSGTIINMSGGGATSPLARFSAYGVSKAAVVRLTETLAEEVRDYGITVNAIAPGAVDTPLQDAVLEAGERAGDLYGRIKALRESGAGGTAVEVPAQLAVFLASDESNGLTGRLIAAPHDGWQQWDAPRIKRLEGTPWFTLRRIDPFTIRPLENSEP